ncbi:hypothetical protein [Halovivax gelatinilyticus]|uniref:hypothetical protein n=1 Tax=Halovivax gelatinilyticus TaxID=2961597 RepID=UPI0020CA3F38|nr:hypothetical protein [Halovivax gelatinilyticus]
MGEKKFTLFELHLDGDTQFGPRSLPDFIATGDDADAETEGVGTSPMDEDENDDGGRSVLPVIIGLVALVGVAFAVRKYRSDDGAEEIEDREVVVN